MEEGDLGVIEEQGRYSCHERAQGERMGRANVDHW